MVNLIVVDNPKTWQLHVPGVPLVSARAYLTEPQYSDMRNAKVFNLCRSYRYQSTGYYVSLLAMARGHRPIPSITTIQDMKVLSIARIVADDLEDLIAHGLAPIKSPSFTLSIYFGRNMAKRYDELSSRLFRLFQAPLLQADFIYEDEQWSLRAVRPMAASDIPESHLPFVIEAATSFFAQNRMPTTRRTPTQYDIAILHNPGEPLPPSTRRTLPKFVAAAKRLNMGVELIEREDFGRLAEFDALFIRETTAVHHHTYRFARRAAAEGLVVIDDPESIAKCSNKVYLTELMLRHKVPVPKTLIVHRDNWERIGPEIGFPVILKQPDSSFSRGVLKADNEKQLQALVENLLEKSDLVVAQEFVPTDYDWRIGVLDKQPLFACKYYMLKEHWQIAKTDENGTRYGNVDPVALEQVPRVVLQTAVRAARLIGDGLYGVDLKPVSDGAMVIEINDNPNIDSGSEDYVLRDELYNRIMRVFLARIQQKKDGVLRGPA